MSYYEKKNSTLQLLPEIEAQEQYYSEETLPTEKRTWTEWYLGDRTSPIMERRFMGNRFGIVAFALIHLAVFLLLLMVILVPIFYYVIIPQMIAVCVF